MAGIKQMPGKSGLLSIGDFSAITGVSIHSLRYYDEIGALVPAYVDPLNNYRYYRINQLDRILAIDICKEAGINLCTMSEFIENESVDYISLINESKDAIDKRISNYRSQQDELNKLKAFIDIRDIMAEKEEALIRLPAMKLWSMPLEIGQDIVDEADLLIKMSKHVKKFSCTIDPMLFGLIRKTKNEDVRTYGFARIGKSCASPESMRFIIDAPEGSFIAKRSSECSMRDADSFLADHCPGNNDALLLSLVLVMGDLNGQLRFIAAGVPPASENDLKR